MQQDVKNEEMRLKSPDNADQNYDTITLGNDHKTKFEVLDAGYILPPNPKKLDISQVLRLVAKHVVRLSIPIVACLIITIAVVTHVPYYSQSETTAYPIYIPFVNKDVDNKTRFWQSIVNALIIVGIIIVMTIIFVILYKFKCYKILYTWLLLVSFFILFVFMGQFLMVLCFMVGFFTDYISFFLFIWNFGMIGILAMYWKSPLVLQQSYLVVIASIVAILFIKLLPEWTAWCLLVLLALWDLIAVLCPKGPLRIFAETAHERGQAFMPSLLYSTSAVWLLMAVPGDGVTETTETMLPTGSTSENLAVEDFEDSPEDSTERTNEERGRTVVDIVDDIANRQDEGMKLGMGDFIFYGVLAGKASSFGDIAVIMACSIALLIGMLCTLIVLFYRGHPLPALPISVCFGCVFYFGGRFMISPFLDRLADQQIYI